MTFHKEASPFFTKQFHQLDRDTQIFVRKKMDQATENPTQNKRLRFPGQVYRIRFSDNRADKRLIYEIIGNRVIFRCILDRKDKYRDLDKYLTKRS